MNHTQACRKDRLRIVAINAIMLIAVITIVTTLTLMMMGYNFNRGGVGQNGLVQFASRPSGATIFINGYPHSSRTSSRTTLPVGDHTIRFSRPGFDTWQRDITLAPGQVLWLNYARLFPTQRTITTIHSYTSIANASTSPNSQLILLTFADLDSSFHLLDIRGDEVRRRVIPTNQFLTQPTDEYASRHLDIIAWSDDSNRVLIRHFYDDTSEWILLNLRDISGSINLTNTYRLDFTDVQIASRDGRHISILENNNLRRADVTNRTISAVLVDEVTEFTQLNRDVVAFLSTVDQNGLIRIGTYRHGERGASILYSVEATDDPIFISGGSYFNRDYVVIAHGYNLVILRGSFPSFGRPASPLAEWRNLTLDFPAESLSLSDNSRFIVVTNHERAFTYDLETSIGTEFTLQGTFDRTLPTTWFDDFMIYTTIDDQLVVYDFDGHNIRHLTTARAGFDIAISPNNRFLYTIIQDDETHFRLVRMNLLIRN